MSRDWHLFLDDLIESAYRIRQMTAGLDQVGFHADSTVQYAVMMNLLIIGEAVKKLPDEGRRLTPEIDWRAVAGMRDLIAHHYFAMDVEIVWDTAINHIPALLSAVENIRDQIANEGQSS